MIDLDKSTQSQLNRGQRLQEILKQSQYVPVPLENQVILLFAGTNGFTDPISVDKMKAWEIALLRYMEMSYPEIGKDIAAQKKITPENEAKLRQALDAFNRTWQS